MTSWIDALLPENITTPPLSYFLDLPDLRDWATHFSGVDDARKTCPRGDWLLWLSRRVASETLEIRNTVSAASACARWLLSRIPVEDPQARRAIELAEEWAADGTIDVTLLREAGDASLESAMRLDGNVRYAEVSVCGAVSAACRLADPTCDASTLVRLVNNCYRPGAFAWAKAHAAMDSLFGKIPRDQHEQKYRQIEAAAIEEARSALDAIIRNQLT